MRSDLPSLLTITSVIAHRTSPNAYRTMIKGRPFCSISFLPATDTVSEWTYLVLGIYCLTWVDLIDRHDEYGRWSVMKVMELEFPRKSCTSLHTRLAPEQVRWPKGLYAYSPLGARTWKIQDGHLLFSVVYNLHSSRPLTTNLYHARCRHLSPRFRPKPRYVDERFQQRGLTPRLKYHWTCSSSGWIITRSDSSLA